ncbi:hypothetical protein [Streptomyces sp. SM10]|uniref:hypothetical protein n=1 Tax=Streptomyces sp. SM10 TaxID=565556 RepID=UPI0035BBC99A
MATSGLPADEEAGRGLLLVGALAEEWGVLPRDGAPDKTVWAEIEGPACERAAPVRATSR